VDMTLYAVGASGRVNLGDMLKGVKFVHVAEHTDSDGRKDGSLILTPINVVPATGKSAEPTGTISDGAMLPDADDDEDAPEGEAPWE